MSNGVHGTSPAKNFVIENNIIKGASRQYPDNFQVGQQIFDTLGKKPDHVSQIEAETGKKTTFAEMKDRSVRCALWLKKQGIGRNDIIAIRSNDDVNAYIPIFATFYLGATYNAMNHLLSLEQTQELLKIIQPKILFISGKGNEMLIEAVKIENNNYKIIVFDDCEGFQSLNDILHEQTDYEVKNFQPEKVASPEDLSYILLSSGTTALPKPIMHSYENLIKQIFSYPLVAKNVILWYAPTYWASGFMSLLQNTFYHKTRIIHAKFDPEETSKVIEEYKIEQIIITAPDVDRFCQSNVLRKYQLKSLELVLMGGSKVNRRMLKEFHESLPHTSIRQVLGTSEGGCVMTAQTENCKEIYSVGYVMPGVEIKVRDLQTNKALGPNAYGELCVKVSTIMKGYFKNEKATNETIDAEGWYHTGDAVYYNEDGEFFVVDRVKDVIIYKNHQIWPSQIEDILLSRDDILEASVVAVPHETDGELPVAFVKKAPNSNVTEEELVKSFESLGENKKLYGGVKFIDKLPRLAGGKIVKRKLIEMTKAVA